VVLLFLGAALNYGDRTAITAVFPLLQRDLGMSDVALAAVSAFFLWSYAVCSPVAGYLGDRFSRTALIAWSLGGWSAVTLLSAFAFNTVQLLSMRLALGVAEAAYMPAAVALIAEYHGKATRATALSIHAAGYSVGMVAGGALAGFLGMRFGWRAPLLVLGVVGLVLASVAVRFFSGLRPSEGPETDETASFPERIPPFQAVRMVLGLPTCRLILLNAMLASIAIWPLITWMPMYLHENLGLTLTQAGFAGTFYAQIAATVGFLVGGRVSDVLVGRRDPRYRILLYAGFILAAAPFLLAFLWSREFPVVAVATVAFFLLRTFGLCNEGPILTELLPSHLRATAIGLSNALNCIAGGAGVLLAGCCKHAVGLSATFGAAAGVYLICAMVLFLGYARYKVLDTTVSQAAQPCH
jgi:MFS family permease